MRTLGRGVLAVGKALLAQVAVVGFWLALGLVLSLVFGVTGRFDRWVRTHNISPSLLVAIAVFLTVCAQQGAREQKTQQMQRPPDERGPGPPHRAGGPAR
jgi:low affinity Fe/Cu permease